MTHPQTHAQMREPKEKRKSRMLKADPYKGQTVLFRSGAVGMEGLLFPLALFPQKPFEQFTY